MKSLNDFLLSLTSNKCIVDNYGDKAYEQRVMNLASTDQGLKNVSAMLQPGQDGGGRKKSNKKNKSNKSKRNKDSKRNKRNKSNKRSKRNKRNKSKRTKNKYHNKRNK